VDTSVSEGRTASIFRADNGGFAVKTMLSVRSSKKLVKFFRNYEVVVGSQ
jgi:hypothetical protein